MPVTYEWVVETLDFYEGCYDDPDIIDTSAWNTLEEAHNFALKREEPWRIALRRDIGNDLDGIIDRGYAYPDESGRLTDRFETMMGAQDGALVPSRFKNLIIPTQEN